MALTTTSIPLGNLVDIFKRHGVTGGMFVSFISYMVNIGRFSDKAAREEHLVDITEALELDSLTKNMLKLESTPELLELVNVINLEFTDRAIVSYTIKDRVILVELA